MGAVQMVIIASIAKKSNSTNDTMEAPNQIPIKPPKLLVQFKKPLMPIRKEVKKDGISFDKNVILH